MAEILVRARNNSHADPAKDLMCYKRGMPVVIMPDGQNWGNAERLPSFVVIKIPGVSVAAVKKYIAAQMDSTDSNLPKIYRRRLWRIRWEDLPAGAQTKLATAGELIIKVGTYAGTYDYTWAQVKGYFRNLATGLDETADL